MLGTAKPPGNELFTLCSEGVADTLFRNPGLSQISFDAVIATRDRPDALALSVPALLGQSRRPSKLIVIDASDNHAAVRRTVERAAKGWNGEVIVEHSPPGLTRQRNRGLAHVDAPVVFFPDDDSIFLEGASAEIMSVYDRDDCGRIAGVCAAEAASPPDGLLPNACTSVRGNSALRRGTLLLRRWLERRFYVLKPALLLGRTLNAGSRLPEWLAEMDVVPVEYMTGFRMTFRTDAIRPTGFDEALGAYGLEEDVDASFTAMRAGLVVGARRARVYHHRWPNKRGDPYALGRMEVLNRAHVLLKHARGAPGTEPLRDAIWRRHLGFTVLKLLSLLPWLHRSETRMRFAGAYRGHLMAVQIKKYQTMRDSGHTVSARSA